MVSWLELIIYAFFAVMLLPALALFAVLWWYFRLGRALAHAGRRLGVRWWDAAGPVVAMAGLLAVVALLGDVPGEGEPGSIPFAIGMGCIVVGTVSTAVAIGNLDEYRQIRRGTDRMAGLDDGPAVLAGTADTDESVVSAPLSGTPSLWYSLRITEDRGIGYRKFPAECHYERADTRFVVDDGTGTVVVDPTDGAVRLWDRPLLNGADVKVRADNTDADVELSTVREQAETDADPDQSFVEHRIEPDTEVTVLGTVARDPEARYPVVSDGDRRLVVFEGTVEAVRRRLRRWVQGGAVVGVAGFAVGAVVILSVGGVV